MDNLTTFMVSVLLVQITIHITCWLTLVTSQTFHPVPNHTEPINPKVDGKGVQGPIITNANGGGTATFKRSYVFKHRTCIFIISDVSPLAAAT